MALCSYIAFIHTYILRTRVIVICSDAERSPRHRFDAVRRWPANLVLSGLYDRLGPAKPSVLDRGTIKRHRPVVNGNVYRAGYSDGSRAVRPGGGPRHMVGGRSPAH